MDTNQMMVLESMLKISGFNRNSNIMITLYIVFKHFCFVPTGNGFTDEDAKYFADALSVSVS